MNNCKDLKEVRDNIDIIDNQIVKLIAERSLYVKQASKFKKDAAEVKAPQRVDTIIEKVRKLAEENNLSPEIIENVYRNMIDSFIRMELQEHIHNGKSETVIENSIIRFFERDRFANFIGIELISVNSGHAVTRLELQKRHLNGLDVVQGGAIYTLADFAFAAAINSCGIATVGINTSISYFKAPTGKFITAEAKEISSDKKICGCDVNVFDEDGSLVAKFIGTGYRKNILLDFINNRAIQIKK